MQKKFSSLHKWLAKLPGFSKPDKHSLAFHNATQFFGALNDNIYKLAVIFFIIGLEGPENANNILAAAGAVFVIPFLLFSSAAGILADRLSKNRFIIGIKTTEIIVMLFAIGAFALKLKLACYVLLFLLSTQSAFFGPPKYGIIPELVSKQKVSKANGLITSFTYLAIILGTFLASFLTEVTGRNFLVVGAFCLLVAIAGFLTSFGIKHTPPRGLKKKINPLFVVEIVQTLSKCRSKKHLLASIFGASYFLFIGAFTQLNIIPFAINSMKLNEVAGGYLFLTTALGIALGSVIAGRASKKKIELGLSCVSGLLLGAIFILLGSYSHLYIVIAALFVLGVFGGNFIVPFEAYIQLFSPEENRGHVIAATNFLSFLGVLLASFAIFFFNELLGLTSAQSFIVVGVMTLVIGLVLTFRLSDLFFAYTARKLLYPFVKIKPESLNPIRKSRSPLLILKEPSIFKAWLLSGILPNITFHLPRKNKRPSFSYSIKRGSIQGITADNNDIPCIYAKTPPVIPKKPHFDVIEVTIEKNPDTKNIHIACQKKS